MQETLKSAYEILNRSIVYFQNQPVGTIAALDQNAPAENYCECFVRDFFPSALVFLLDDQPEIVKNFLSLVVRVRDMQEEIAGHQNLPRVMPASFRVVSINGKESIQADFGDRAIGRVAPVDSMMWWVILLDIYTQITGDIEFAHSDECQRSIRLILGICLRDRFEVFPTLLVPDGSFMIDRRMGVFGHPLEIQSLFYAVLNSARRLLIKHPDNEVINTLSGQRQDALREYVHSFYWLDSKRLNEIHRFENELFGDSSKNAFNVYPESIPEWVAEWLPEDAGYLVGNLGPGRMDVRFFSFGNLLAILFGLADHNQSQQIIKLFEHRWQDLVGMMPVKICYPAMHGVEWHLMTGSDPKNSPWSYHNGGNWPCLNWAFVAACIHVGRADLAQGATDVALRRLASDHWPEYYDGRAGRLIGRRSNQYQTWSAAALILAYKFIDDPECLKRLGIIR